MGSRWQCGGVINYIIWEMMSMSCGNWRQHLGNRMQCDVVIGDSTWVLGGDEMGLLTTSSGK
jgi:hypothetical protein